MTTGRATGPPAVSHTGAMGEDGTLVVFEVWESVAAKRRSWPTAWARPWGRRVRPTPLGLSGKHVLGHHAG